MKQTTINTKNHDLNEERSKALLKQADFNGCRPVMPERIDYIARVSNINRSALIRELVEEWCASQRQIPGVAPMTQPHYEFANDRALIIDN